MKIEIAKEIEADASLKIVVGKMNYILAEVVGKGSDEAAAHWELAGDLKSRILFLQLWYETQAGGTTIDPKELEDPVELKHKLRILWGDILRVTLDKNIAQMKARIREEVGS